MVASEKQGSEFLKTSVFLPSNVCKIQTEKNIGGQVKANGISGSCLFLAKGNLIQGHVDAEQAWRRTLFCFRFPL